MYEIQHDALGAQMEGWQTGFETSILMAHPPSDREQPAALQQRAVQRYREMWRGEHEITSEASWVAGWLRGYNVGHWISTNVETAVTAALAALGQLRASPMSEDKAPPERKPRRRKPSN